MHALQLLKEDHEQVGKLFAMAKDSRDITQKRRIFADIKRALEVHSHMEEAAFYPEFADRQETRELIEDSVDDHHEIAELLSELEGVKDDATFLDRFEELVDDFQSHVDEEEGELFPKVEALM